MPTLTKTKPKTKPKSKPKIKDPKTMAEAAKFYGAQLVPFRQGEVIEVVVTQKNRNRVFVDIGNYTSGFIPEKEFSFDASDLKPGDKILAYVLSMENDAGFVVLSLRRADRQRIWQTLTSAHQTGEPVRVKVKAANRGGLMVEFGGQEGFMPVSQLSPIHYPKVEGGDVAKILAKLKQLVATFIDAKVITLDRQNNRLIFSEKAIDEDRLLKAAKNLKMGEIVQCQVSGVVDFGLFVKIPTGPGAIEGLIHISEISWDKVDKINEKFNIGDEIKAMVISIEKSKISLSLKRLEKSPWDNIGDSLTVGQKIIGDVTNLTPFGAFVKLPNGLDALLHVSQIDKKTKLEQGKSYEFFILSIDTKAHKISLTTQKSALEAKPIKATPKTKPSKKVAKKKL